LAALYLLSAVVGVVSFVYPFFLPELVRQTSSEGGAGANQLIPAPALTMLLVVFCLAILLLEIQGQAVSVKIVAALGVLVAITSVLRFVETAIPGPAGFSPIFAPIILSGYVFGARFGFLMGSLTLLASALVTGGAGPWLPYQMFTAGWLGLTAGWLPHTRRPGAEMGLLLCFGFAWGLAYGAITNLYFWPFVAGEASTSWQPGSPAGEIVGRYLAFYLATSLPWDLAGALGNVVLIWALGRPAIRALARFRDRFHFQIQPA
jgi:energy-coupling factor transport system substrate-specific component